MQGWRYLNEQPISILPNEQGWLWSEELETWLEPNKAILRLRDRAGNLFLSEVEQGRADAREAKLEAERKLAEALAKLAELTKNQQL